MHYITQYDYLTNHKKTISQSTQLLKQFLIGAMNYFLRKDLLASTMYWLMENGVYKVKKERFLKILFIFPQ
jgi:hypothetical protein